jgi:hypothetical protein
MSQVIEFYVPASFRWNFHRSMSGRRGQLILFPEPVSSSPLKYQDTGTSNLEWVRTNIRSALRSRR